MQSKVKILLFNRLSAWQHPCPRLAELPRELTHLFGVGALFVGVKDTLEVLTGASAISHHIVVLTQLVQAEQVERVEGQG